MSLLKSNILLIFGISFIAGFDVFWKLFLLIYFYYIVFPRVKHPALKTDEQGV